MKVFDRFKSVNLVLINRLLLVLFTAILFFITIQKYDDYKLKITLGDIAENDIRATKEIEDEYSTNKLIEEAKRNVLPKYRISPSIQMAMKDTIGHFLDSCRDIKGMNNISFTKKAELLSESTKLELSTNELYTALRMEFKELNTYETLLNDLINQVMGSGIREEELEYEKEKLSETFATLNLTGDQRTLGLNLLNQTIKANEFIDVVETERKKVEAANSIKPIIIKENEIIANKGDLIDEGKLHLIKESGLLKDQSKGNFSSILGIGLLILLGIGFLYGYIYFFNKEILYNNKLQILLLVILLTIIISKGIYSISPYLMPVSIAALLIAILIDNRLAIVVNLFVSFFLGFLLKLEINILFMYILSGSIGVLTVIGQQQRYNIFLNGLAISLSNIILILSFGLTKENINLQLLTRAMYSSLNGIFSGVFTLGSLPIWENVFYILTPIKLLELSNPNQPLLRKLLLEAPGTYHHSLLVGNLSESAAEAIGANPLLTRVGSYYHDIGKSKKPYYFKENQFGMENPHDKLQPKQSADIIISHTIDGNKMAKEKRLPKEIIDIINEHHGNTAVAYFYYKAKEKNLGLDIHIDDFRYKGAKPQTKESALVMLADSTEAAVRSIKEPTREKIEEMVEKVVMGKFNDGQLDECDITFKDISTTINIFVNVLVGIYHDRIEYPNMEVLAKEEI